VPANEPDTGVRPPLLLLEEPPTAFWKNQDDQRKAERHEGDEAAELLNQPSHGLASNYPLSVLPPLLDKEVRECEVEFTLKSF
jgi:hypothetical protein